jgi:hypothetical protein
MKKNILTVLISLISICGFSQKLTIEKGKIKLDEITVAYVEGKKPHFKVFNLDKSYVVNVELKFLADSGFGKRWMVVKSEKTGKSNEVDYKKFSPQNQEKSAIQTFIDQTFLTSEGLDSDAIENYINGESTGFSAKIKEGQNKLAQQKAFEDSFQLTVDDAGIIYSAKARNKENAADKKIGSIKMTSPSTNGELKYEVTDLDGYLIATWFAKNGTYNGYNGFLSEELITADQKLFKAAFDNRGNPIGYRMSKDITASNIVKILIFNGYTLEHQGIDIQNKINLNNLEIKKENAKLNKEKYETAKLNSVNIYNKKGFVIRENGEKVTGVFKIEFEEISNNKSSSSSSFVPGQKLYQTDITDHFQIYRSKSGIRFCIDENKEYYIGLICKGGNFLSSGIKALNADNSAFYKILYESNGSMVLAHPAYLDELIIKTPNQENGLFTTKVTGNKLKKNISEYLKCDSFVFENYDFKTVEGLIKVLQDCNK